MEISQNVVSLDLIQTPLAPLASHLLDLLQTLEGSDVPLILVGGFGLLLRQEYLKASNIQTLYPKDDLPARTTSDLDVILKLEVIANATKIQTLRQALDTLDYTVIPSAREYQFAKSNLITTGSPSVKIDLLARIPEPERGDPELSYDARRVKPQPKGSLLHARTTPEAIAVEDNLLPLRVRGRNTNGEMATGTLYLANPYALYLMKLFAFRDEEENRKERQEGHEDYARKHAQDIATITALLTEDEDATLGEDAYRYRDHPIAKEAVQIVRQYFSTPESSGLIRLIEAKVALNLRSLVLETLRRI